MAKYYRAITIASGFVLILVALLTYSGLVNFSNGIIPWQGFTPPVWAPMAGPIFLSSFIGLWTISGNGPVSNIGANFYMAVFTLIPISLASLFWVSGRGLFRGDSNIPRWLLWASLVIGVLHVDFFFESWNYGLKYQGLAHTVAVSVENAVLFGAIVTVYVIGRRNPSFGRNLLCRWLFFFWLVWCAFPFLGELI